MTEPLTSEPTPPRKAIVIVARRLDGMQSGSSQYLKTYLKLSRDAGLSTTIVFAPRRSFGNLAWARIHGDIEQLADGIDWAQTVKIGTCYVSLSPAVWGRFAKRLARELLRRITGRKHIPVPSLLGVELDKREAEQTLRRAKTHAAQIVTAEYSSLAPLLGQIEAARRIVFLHDLFSLRAENFASQGLEPDHAVMSLADEAARCRHATALIHASRAEETRLAEVLPDAQHIWMRPEVSLTRPPHVRRTEPHAVFMGSNHAGNRQALEQLRKTIWPRVKNRLPDACLHIVGSIAGTIDPADAKREGLRLVGRVDDLNQIASADAIGLAPMEFGSGIPIKVFDYLGQGLPVVVTSNVVDSFGDNLDGVLAVATSRTHFADLTAELLQDETARHAMVARMQTVSERLKNDELARLLSRD